MFTRIAGVLAGRSLTVVCLLALAPREAATQESPAPPVGAESSAGARALALPDTLLDRRLAPAESVIVRLARRLIYRVVVHAPAADLTATLLARPGGWATVVPERATHAVSVFELYPPRDGNYAVAVPGLRKDSVRVVIAVDEASVAERAKRDSAPRLTVGLEAAMGAHGGYAPLGALGPSGAASVVDACISIRLNHHVAGCLGYSREAISAGGSAIDFFFGELRITVLGLPQGRAPVNAGFAARVGQGSLSGESVSVDPSLLAAGVWAAWWPVRSTTGRGVSVRASANLARYGNLRGYTVVQPPPPLPGEPERPPYLRVSGAVSDNTVRWLVGVNWHP